MSDQDALLENILDTCLVELRAGRWTVEACLARYPQHAARLAPLLRVAAGLQTQPPPALSEAARQRIEARVQAQLRRWPARRPSAAHAGWPALLRWASTVVLTVLVLSFLTGGAIRASGSLPGEPLYSLKSFHEQVEAWLTPPQGLAEMHVRFAGRRLEEVMALGHMGIADDLAIIKMESELRQAMELLPGLPDDKRREVMQEILALTQRQRIVLSSIMYYVPPMSQAGLEWGLDTATRRAARLEEMLEE